MIKEKDFAALIKVFHAAVTEMAAKDNYFERKAIVQDWIDLMGQVDRAMGGILTENKKEERLSMVKDFEKIIEELGYGYMMVE